MGTVGKPPGGLGSNSNYIIAGNGQPILGLAVEVVFNQVLWTNIGFGVQLNAYSPAGQLSALQQYFFQYEVNDPPGFTAPGTLYGRVEPWPVTTVGLGKQTTKGDLINQAFTVASLTESMIQPGSSMTISLANDSSGNVRYITFTFVDQNNNTYGTQPTPIDLLTLPLDNGTGQLATQADLAPIAAFQLNIVGPINSEQSWIATGGGTITYRAQTQIAAYSTLKDLSFTVDSGNVTEETANTTYGTVESGFSTSITQSFSVVPVGGTTGGVAATQQVGLTQTDVCWISAAGSPTVSFVSGGGRWSSLQSLSPTGLADSTAGIAVSQQFGAGNQTDLFVVGQNGELYVFWTDGASPWGGPETITPSGLLTQQLAPSGAQLAATQQFGATNQTDVFLVNNSGQLTVFWVVDTQDWNGPEGIGATGFAPPGASLAASQQFGASGQTDVFVVDNKGQLNVFWVEDTKGWNGPLSIGSAGLAPAGAPVAVTQHFGVPNRTDVFVVGNNGQVNMFWVIGDGVGGTLPGGWNGPVTIGPVGFAPPGASLAASQQFGTTDQTDVFVVGSNGQLNVLWAVGTGDWNVDTIGPASQAPPGARVAVSQQFGVSGQTDVFVASADGQLNVFWVDDTQNWNGPEAIPG
jgi:hypothetical protein